MLAASASVNTPLASSKEAKSRTRSALATDSNAARSELVIMPLSLRIFARSRAESSANVGARRPKIRSVNSKVLRILNYFLNVTRFVPEMCQNKDSVACLGLNLLKQEFKEFWRKDDARWDGFWLSGALGAFGTRPSARRAKAPGLYNRKGGLSAAKFFFSSKPIFFRGAIGTPPCFPVSIREACDSFVLQRRDWEFGGCRSSGSVGHLFCG